MRLSTSSFKISIALIAGILIILFAVNYLDHAVMKTYDIEGEQDILLKKLHYLEKHKDEITVLFVGTSRVYHGVDPVYFDSLMKEKIPGIKSYNLAAPGLSWTEVLYSLDHISQLNPPNLKYVIFEPIPVANVYPANLETAENLRVHDLNYTIAAIKNIVTSNRRFTVVTNQVYYHLLSFLRRITCTGCIVNYFSNELVLSRGGAHTEVYEDVSLNGGFLALDDDRPVRRQENEEFMQTAKERLAFLEPGIIERIINAEKSPKEDPVDNKILVLVEAARRIRAEPAIIIPSDLFNQHELDGRAAYFQEKSGIKVWDFVDPRRYPEFLKPENRWEEKHLSKKGALIFTEKLADEFIKSFSQK